MLPCVYYTFYYVLLLVTTICQYCLKDVHTRTKVHNHIAYRTKLCKTYYQTYIPDKNEDLINELERDESIRVKQLVKDGFSKLYSPFHVLKLSGPILKM